jgi:energy-coupling factor transporter transmembrane protein EcfT
MDPLFSFSKGKSLIHRTPAWLKLLVLIAVPVTISPTPLYVCLALMAAFAVLAMASGMGFTRFLRDLRPIAVYCIMIVLIDVLSYVFFSKSRAVVTQNSLNLILRLLCAMEATSVFFRTTSSYEITSTLQAIERAVTFGHSKLVISGMLSLFLSFLPQIFRTWSDIDCAYRSRGGKRGPAKIVTLLPVLITASMKKASTTYMALLDRN